MWGKDPKCKTKVFAEGCYTHKVLLSKNRFNHVGYILHILEKREGKDNTIVLKPCLSTVIAKAIEAPWIINCLREVDFITLQQTAIRRANCH